MLYEVITLVPAYKMGNYFRDISGRMNQFIASEADEVYLAVSGIPVRVKWEAIQNTVTTQKDRSSRRDFLKSFLLMIVYFTRIPIRYRYDYNEKDLSKGIILFPLIGVIIGLFAFIPALIEVFFSTVQSELSGLEVIELLFKNSFLTQNHAFSISRYITAVISWLLYIV